MSDFISSFLQFFEEKTVDAPHFLSNSQDENASYADIFEKMLDSDERRLIINIDDVRAFDSGLANEQICLYNA